MEKIIILAEGQTESGFAKAVLAPYFLNYGILLESTIVSTKIVKSGPNFKGGITSYRKFKKEIMNLLGDSSAKAITTMIDYYGLPTTFPGHSTKNTFSNCYKRVKYLEEELKKSINNKRFVPYLQLHEFESLLFSSPKDIDITLFGKERKKSPISKARSDFKSPEEINDNPTTCPSRRIINTYPNYEKVLQGQMISQDIGIEKIMQECKHFANWIEKIKKVI